MLMLPTWLYVIDIGIAIIECSMLRERTIIAISDITNIDTLSYLTDSQGVLAMCCDGM